VSSAEDGGRKALGQPSQRPKTVDQSCHLSVLNGSPKIVVAQVDAPEGMFLVVKISTALEQLKSECGRVLLAFKDEEAHRLLSLVEPEASGTGGAATFANQQRKPAFLQALCLHYRRYLYMLLS
jgi:DNA-binding IclR family transcriptional regulator